MRLQAYHLFEIVAWPALVWCAVESALRLGVGDHAGLGTTLLTAACAAGTIVAARSRSRSLTVAFEATGRGA